MVSFLMSGVWMLLIPGAWQCIWLEVLCSLVRPIIALRKEIFVWVWWQIRLNCWGYMCLCYTVSMYNIIKIFKNKYYQVIWRLLWIFWAEFCYPNLDVVKSHSSYVGHIWMFDRNPEVLMRYYPGPTYPLFMCPLPFTRRGQVILENLLPNPSETVLLW